jgi:hypothetical protein
LRRGEENSRLSISKEIVMGQYDPRTVSELGSIIDDICEALRSDGGAPLSPEMKQALAKRVLELFDNGITDPDVLRIGVMADSLWASSRTAQT